MTANIKQKLGMAIKLKCCYAKFMDQIVAPETSKGEIKTCETLATTFTNSRIKLKLILLLTERIVWTIILSNVRRIGDLPPCLPLFLGGVSTRPATKSSSSPKPAFAPFSSYRIAPFASLTTLSPWQDLKTTLRNMPGLFSMLHFS